MKNDKLITNQIEQHNSVALAVMMKHRKRLSRYKLKKQTSLAEKILQDTQIFEP